MQRSFDAERTRRLASEAKEQLQDSGVASRPVIILARVSLLKTPFRTPE